MDIELPNGTYVVAVSGGVDSMVLLDVLQAMPAMQLTVAHYDHGIRSDSGEDRKLVQAAARQYGLPFVYHAGKLGPSASETQARHARYTFLQTVRAASGAQAIITAHHQDDVLETIILNLLRGTGRRGLSSLQSTDVVKRPLLGIPKAELRRYARSNGLRWREDSTNSDERYQRNYVRHRIVPRFSAAEREQLLAIGSQTGELNGQITEQLGNYLHLQPALKQLNRHDFILLPHAVAREVMAEWLLQNTTAELSKQRLERLVIAAKTGRIGTKTDVDATHWLKISSTTLALEPRER